LATSSLKKDKFLNRKKGKLRQNQCCITKNCQFCMNFAKIGPKIY
jgi:hypothetical protein